MIPGQTELSGAAARPLSEWLREMRIMLGLAFPIILTQLSQIAMQTTDVIMIGRLGSSALGAAQLGSQSFFMIWLFGLGVVLAVSPLIAQAYGAQNERAVRRTVRQGLWAALILTGPAWLILAQTDSLLLLLGQSETAASRAQVYQDGLMWSYPFALSFIVLRHFASALMRPGPALAIAMVAILINALLDYALIYGNFGLPRYELFGAGIATAMVSSFQVVAMMLVATFHPAFKPYQIFRRFWVADWDRLKRIFQLGLPIGGTIISTSAFFFFAAISIGWISEAALAAHAIGMQCTTVAFMLPLGVGQAATVRVGQAVGRGVPAGVGVAGGSAFILGTLVCFGLAILLIGFSDLLARQYLDLSRPDSGQVLEIASGMLVIAGVFVWADGMQVVAGHSLRGLNDTRVPLLIVIFGYWVVGAIVVMILAFVLDYGALGVWGGMGVALYVTALIGIYRFYKREAWGLIPSPEEARNS